jgi:hypothetical protein
LYVADNYAKGSTPNDVKGVMANMPITGCFTPKTFGSAANTSAAWRRIAKAWISVGLPSRTKCFRKNSAFGFRRPL